MYSGNTAAPSWSALRLKVSASQDPMFWRAGFTPPPELAPLSMPVRPSGGNAASELRLLRRSGALSR